MIDPKPYYAAVMREQAQGPLNYSAAIEHAIAAAIRDAYADAARIAEQPLGKGIGDRDDHWQPRIATAIRAAATDGQAPPLQPVAVIDALEAVADAADRLVSNATGLQEQFNPESYEIYADDYLRLADALTVLAEAESERDRAGVDQRAEGA